MDLLGDPWRDTEERAADVASTRDSHDEPVRVSGIWEDLPGEMDTVGGWQSYGADGSGNDETEEAGNESGGSSAANFETIRKYPVLAADVVQVTEAADREGVVFKHTNYVVEFEGASVVRRYSDFAWLQNVLIRRYPFRLVAELPPKRLNAASADAAFLRRRRRGLSRFLNLLLKHPVLKNDTILKEFLTITQDLSNWKSGWMEVRDELDGRTASPEFRKNWHKESAEMWNKSCVSIDSMIELWSQMGVIMEHYEKNVLRMAKDQEVLQSLVKNMQTLNPDLYGKGNSIPEINNHLGIVNNHLTETMSLAKREINDYSTLLVPKFKIFVDVLISLKNLFERYKMLGGNNIPHVYKHVESNMARLESMKGNPDTNGTEYDKIKASIEMDKQTILQQSNRAWLIRECIMEEFAIFQQTQYMISSAFKEWAKLNSDFTGLNLNQWENLVDHLQEMPTYPNV